MEKKRAAVVYTAPEGRLRARGEEISKAIGSSDVAIALPEGTPIRKEQIEKPSEGASERARMQAEVARDIARFLGEETKA